jgi:hypothetical protein
MTPRFETAIRHTINKSGISDAIRQAQELCGITEAEAREYVLVLQRSKPLFTDDHMRQLWRRDHRKPWDADR